MRAFRSGLIIVAISASLMGGVNLSANAAGSCDAAAIDKIVKWVVEDDADAKQKFGDAVRGGQNSFDALVDRLDHDDNAQKLVKACSVEARQSLANRGYHS